MTSVAFRPPSVGEKNLAVRLTPSAEREVRRGHPWVFDRSIESVSHEGAPGDLAVIFDGKRQFLAVGLFDPASPIRVRIVHRGRPARIDAGFWADRVLDALQVRQGLAASGETTAYRLINGENDGFGGLVVDRYDSVAVMKIYSLAWLPHLPHIVDALVDATDLDTVITRFGRLVRGEDMHGLVDGEALVGSTPFEPVPFLENGLLFDADVVAGQKTGHFLDQRDNRAIVRSMAGGARVLDVFSCTGGFSVHAAAGGAVDVTSVDAAGPALRAAERHMRTNTEGGLIGSCKHRVVEGDAFEVMAAMSRRGERYDLVVIDPPSFANRQANVAAALRSYQRLTALGLDLLHDGALLVQASCSSRVTTDDFLAVVRGAAADAGVALDNELVTGHAVDHPVTFREGAYLKALFANARFEAY